MTPVQKLKYAILDLHHIWEHGGPILYNMTGNEIDEAWDMADDLTDAMNEIRSGGFDTGLETESSRHYENTASAVQCPTGEWVGYTYWYGGGKHGNPEEIDWIEYAYDIECVSEQKLVTVNTFTRR